ncbi:MAG: amino acid dehydrogenase, partial [Pseudomonadales bacterium]|nr:amino acid dehydrogenase [Pseudomonadales bacterium]
MQHKAHPEYDQHEQVVVHDTPELRAIIAIHNSSLGVATGGCRIFPYQSMDETLTDVLRLSRGMTYKSA